MFVRCPRLNSPNWGKVCFIAQGSVSFGNKNPRARMLQKTTITDLVVQEEGSWASSLTSGRKKRLLCQARSFPTLGIIVANKSHKRYSKRGLTPFEGGCDNRLLVPP